MLKDNIFFKLIYCHYEREREWRQHSIGRRGGDVFLYSERPFVAKRACERTCGFDLQGKIARRDCKRIAVFANFVLPYEKLFDLRALAIESKCRVWYINYIIFARATQKNTLRAQCFAQ